MTEPTLPPEPAKDASADEIVQDIAATREHLAETIDALEDKLNVPLQAKRKVDETRAQVLDKVNDTRASVTDKVNGARSQVGQKVTQAKAQLADRLPSRDRGSVDGNAPAAAHVPDSSTSTPTGPAQHVRRAQAWVADQAPRVIHPTAQVVRGALPIIGVAIVLAAGALANRQVRRRSTPTPVVLTTVETKTPR